MLVLPIANKERFINARVILYGAKKIRQNVDYKSSVGEDIIVNKEKFSDSQGYLSKDASSPTEFIRNKSLLYPRPFLVTTSKTETGKYDIYEIPQPEKKVNQSLETLYGKVITDLRKEVPGKTKRGRYVSLKELNFESFLTEDKIATLQRVLEHNSQVSLEEILRKYNLLELKEAIDFLVRQFEYIVVSESIISEDSYEEVLKVFDSIHTREYKNLNRYYNIAKSNADILARLSYVYRLLYNKPLQLLKVEDPKQLTKRKIGTENAA